MPSTLSAKESLLAYRLYSLELITEGTEASVHRAFPSLGDFNQNSRLHLRVFIDDTQPQGDTELDRLFRE